MADTITHTWQTVEQAAVTLNVSTRTIARRIAGETIESRVDENGRRLVLVQTFGHPANGSDVADAGQTGNVGDEIDENALAVAATSSIARPVADDETGYASNPSPLLAVLQTTIHHAREDAHRARVGARWAWAGVAFMAVVVAAGGMWVTGRLTTAETKVGMLQDDVQTARADLDRSHNDLMIVSSAKAVADERRQSAEQQLAAAQTKRDAAEAELLAGRRETADAAAAVQVSKPTKTTRHAARDAVRAIRQSAD